VQNESARLVVKLNRASDCIHAVGHHSGRVLDSEVDWHRDIDAANDLLEFVFQELPNEWFGLRNLASGQERCDRLLEALRALRLMQDRTHRGRTLELRVMPACAPT